MTTKEQVAQIAKQAGIPDINACGHSLERFAKLVRNAALEDAAKKCEDIAEIYEIFPSESAFTGKECADSIRNMKD